MKPKKGAIYWCKGSPEDLQGVDVGLHPDRLALINCCHHNMTDKKKHLFVPL